MVIIYYAVAVLIAACTVEGLTALYNFPNSHDELWASLAQLWSVQPADALDVFVDKRKDKKYRISQLVEGSYRHKYSLQEIFNKLCEYDTVIFTSIDRRGTMEPSPRHHPENLMHSIAECPRAVRVIGVVQRPFDYDITSKDYSGLLVLDHTHTRYMRLKLEAFGMQTPVAVFTPMLQLDTSNGTPRAGIVQVQTKRRGPPPDDTLTQLFLHQGGYEAVYDAIASSSALFFDGNPSSRMLTAAASFSCRTPLALSRKYLRLLPFLDEHSAWIRRDGESFAHMFHTLDTHRLAAITRNLTAVAASIQAENSRAISIMRTCNATPSSITSDMAVLPEDNHKMELKAFSIATNLSYPTIPFFIQSAAHRGLSVTFIGVGDEQMKEIPLEACGGETGTNTIFKKVFCARLNFGRKMFYMEEVCRALDPDTVVAFIDAYDSLVVNATEADVLHGYRMARATSHSLRNRYVTFGIAQCVEFNMRCSASSQEGNLRMRRAPDLIFAAEMNCWPNSSLSISYYPYSTHYRLRYLNSGFVIGKAKAFLQLFAAAPFAGTEESDQKYFIQALLHSYGDESFPVIDLDYEGHLVASMSKSSLHLLSVEKERIQVRGRSGASKLLHLSNNKEEVRPHFNKLYTY